MTELQRVAVPAGDDREEAPARDAWAESQVRRDQTSEDYDLVYILREAALLGPPVFERMIHNSACRLFSILTMRFLSLIAVLQTDI